MAIVWKSINWRVDFSSISRLSFQLNKKSRLFQCQTLIDSILNQCLLLYGWSFMNIWQMWEIFGLNCHSPQCVTYINRESRGCMCGAVRMDVCLSQAMKHNTIYSPGWPNTSGKGKNRATRSISNTYTHTRRDAHAHTHQPPGKNSFSSLSLSDISPARGLASLLPLIAFLFCSW